MGLSCIPTEGLAMDTLLTTKQAATYLNVSVNTLNRWRWAGRGPTFAKMGDVVRYSQSDLDAYVAANKHASTTAAQHTAA